MNDNENTINHRRRRRIIAATAATAAVVACGVVAAAPASAASDPYISSNSGGANLRTSPDTGSYSQEYLPNGTALAMICYKDAQSVSPPQSNYTSTRWFKVEPTYDPTIGYVHSSLVTNQSHVGPCPS